MKKVAVSACLLGRNCRYDGSHRLDSELIENLADKEVIPFCPEEAILGTPRETIDIVEGRAVGNESGRDYTEAIEKQAEEFARLYPDIEELYCKAKSPSCALCSARVYDAKGNLISHQGMGIFTKRLKAVLPKILIKERR